MLFLISYFLKINTFWVQLLLRRSFFSRKSNYSKYVLFRSGVYSEQLLFQKRNLFRDRYFFKKKHFFWWFCVTNFIAFKLEKTIHKPASISLGIDSMVRSDFEILHFFIVENSKQRINFNVTNVSFWEPGCNFVIFKQISKNSPCHL